MVADSRSDLYAADMSALEQIKEAIPKLTLEERAEVARCLHEWTDDAWDEQMRGDLAAGKLNSRLAKVTRMRPKENFLIHRDVQNERRLPEVF